MDLESIDNGESASIGRSRGGVARAQSLTASERHDIAQKAAQSRWADIKSQKVLQATHDGDLNLGGTTVACAVLENGIRLVSERGLVKSFGGKRGGAHWRRMTADPHGANLPPIVSATNLKQFIDNDLMVALNERILYRVKGGRPAYGRRAELYPKICDILLKARDAKQLKGKAQTKLALAADTLMRGLAHTGIIALVDEATGYQQVRDRDALEKILDEFIGHELAKWAKRFPDEFYRQMSRLKGLRYDPSSSKRPMILAQITIDLVYDRIGPGLTKELQARRQEVFAATGKRGKLQQLLTEDVGHPALQHHISGITFAARGFRDGDWSGFYYFMDRTAPRFNRTLLLPFEHESKESLA